MKSKTILTESTIRIKARIRDIDGDLVDPDDITFEVKKPGDSSYTVYTLFTGDNFIVKQDTGIYYIDLIIDQPGRWKYSWFTTGDPQSSWKSFFEAEDARYK